MYRHEPVTSTFFRRRALLTFSAILLVLMALGSYVFSSASPPPCPVRVTGSPVPAYEHGQITFTAIPSNYESYIWTVDCGDIAGRQNGSSIRVINLTAGASCTARVTIHNGDCQNTGAKVIKVEPSLMVCPAISVSCDDWVEDGSS